MLLDKLSAGVLRVQTPLGPRYISPTFFQRLLLIWTFRHFEVLPLQVLSHWQQSLIDTLCIQQKFVVTQLASDRENFSVIGTVERRPPVEIESLPPRRPNASVASVAHAAGNAQQRY
ncbi:MAG TPA: hypothetical protein VLK33_02515 [Terriglobales bacterium]|nr:hypothetical protein [Terriglobales bacterium]